MRILFDKDGQHTYALQKDKPGWSLYKWMPERKVEKGKYKGNVVEEGWAPMNRYPHNLRHAIELIAEDDMEHRVGDYALSTTLNHYRDWVKDLDIYIEGVEERLGNDADDA